MSRLVYSILSLLLGALALLLPETRKFPLPRTMTQVELIPTSISDRFRRRRSSFARRCVRADDRQSRPSKYFNDGASMISDVRSTRMGHYDHQSTLHSVYELQEFGHDETMSPLSNRHLTRRMDGRNTIGNQLVSHVTNDIYRHQRSIVEHDDDNRRYSSLKQRRLVNEEDENIIVLPTARIITMTTTTNKQQTSSMTYEMSQSDGRTRSSLQETIIDESKTNQSNPDDVLSRSPQYRRTMSQDENYFSEHC
jgi:hypothetical protein